MISKNVGRQKPGKPISARFLNSMAQGVESAMRLRVGPRMRATSLAGQQAIAANWTDPIMPAVALEDMAAWNSTTGQKGSGQVQLFQRLDNDPEYAQPTGITLDAFNSTTGEVVTGDILLVGWWDESPHIIAVVGSSSGGGGGERCECPEETYEVSVACGVCDTVYGPDVAMPIWWTLTITSSEDNPDAVDPCPDAECDTLSGQVIELENELDEYGDPSCTWSGSNGNCYRAELEIGEETVTLTILDSADCIVATLTMDSEDFACCGVNSAWTQGAEDTCTIEVDLRPHSCTCCPETIECPPDGRPVCKQLVTDCGCRGVCTLTVTVANLATPPGSDADSACGGMNGVYAVEWIGDCTWWLVGGTGGSDAATTTALLTYDGEWTLRLEGPNTQVAVFKTNLSQSSPCDTTPAFACDSTVTMELSYTDSTCPPTTCPTATFLLP